MGRQLEIDWTTEQWRKHLARCGLSGCQVELLLAMRSGEQLPNGLRWRQQSKRKWAKEMHCSPNAVTKAAAKLHVRGLLQIWDSELRTESPVYVMDEPAVRSLEPVQSRLMEAAENGPGWSPVVTGGHQPRAVRVDTHKIRVPCTVPCTDTGEVTSGDQSDAGPGGDGPQARWWARPWAKVGGMPDEVLVRSVLQCDLDPLRRLWSEAKATGRAPMRPSQDDTARFLAACHHCATSEGLNNRMAALCARVRRDPIDLRNVRQASDEWAGAVLKRRAADQYAGVEP